MQEDGKVLAHRSEALSQQVLGRGTYHHVVPILHTQAQQFIPNRATDGVDFHIRVCRAGGLGARLGFEDHLPVHQGVAHLARQFQAQERGILALAEQGLPTDLGPGGRIKEA